MKVFQLGVHPFCVLCLRTIDVAITRSTLPFESRNGVYNLAKKGICCPFGWKPFPDPSQNDL
jgi:hypothetical protein